jgi:type IV secretory pathway VirB4 component
VLAEEIHKHKIPIIFFDTQYEFTPLSRALKGEVLRPGENYTIKLFSLSEAELLDLIPTLKHELHVSILTRAFLRLKEGISPRQTHLATSFPQRRSIGLDELITEIGIVGNEMNAGQHTIDIVTDRTRHYLSSYDFIGEEFNWARVLTPGSITAIDCQGFGGQSLQLVLASTLRELSELRKNKKINPFIIFVDEAHLFVPQDEDSPCKQIIRESVRTGRHYGICVVLITQSPVDIDKKAIRQCNTRLLFAIESDQLQAIQGVKSDATQEMIDRLPKAPVGTCILTGTYETIKHAIPVRIRLMDNPEADAGKAPDIFQEVSKAE